MLWGALTAYLIEKHLGLSQNMLKLSQFKEIAFQCLGILVHLAQFILQLLESGLHNICKRYVSCGNECYMIKYLEINHFTGLWGLGAIASIKHRNTVLLDLLLEVTKLTFHFIASTHLINELTLEGVHIGIKLQKFVGNFI